MRPYSMNCLSNEAHIKFACCPDLRPMMIPLRSSGENKGLQEIPQWCLGNAPSLTPHPLYKCQMRLKDVEMRLKEKSLRQDYTFPGKCTPMSSSANTHLTLYHRFCNVDDWDCCDCIENMRVYSVTSCRLRKTSKTRYSTTKKSAPV